MRKLTCFLIWLILSGQPAFPGEIPEVLYIGDAATPYPSYPSWVSAERVLTPSGEVDPDHFNLADQIIIEKYFKRPRRGGCIWVGREREIETVRIGSQKAVVRESLESTAKSAGWIFSATVTAQAGGFNGSEPGTLLEIIPEKIVKGPRNRRGSHYIFIPVGEVSVGNIKICKTDERYAALPKVGERVILFIDLNWLNEGRFLWTGEDTGVVTIDSRGLIKLPKRYQKTEPWLEGGDEEKLLGFIQKTITRENQK